MCSRNSSASMEIDETLSEITDIKTENDTEVNSNESSWVNFIITKPIGQANAEKERGLALYTKLQESIPSDISVFIQPDEYTLHRTILASKSNYFFAFELQYNGQRMERVISKDFVEYGINSDRFFTMVDIMYGRDINSVLNEHNFVTVFKDMDVLRIEMDLDVLKQFIVTKLVPKAQLGTDKSMFELYDYILSRRTFRYLLPTVSKYFSDRLLKIVKLKELFSLSYEGFVRILKHAGNQKEEDCFIGYICAKWICTEFSTRISFLVDLVNVIKLRYGFLQYCACDKDLITQTLNKCYPETRTLEVEKYLKMLLSYDGEISFISSDSNDEFGTETGIRIWNGIDQPDRWMSFLRNGWFCDIFVHVQGRIFKLHRIKLLSASQYFTSLITNAAKSPLMKCTLDEIDAETFENIIRYVYTEEIEIVSKTDLIKLLKASDFLEMNDLFEKCYLKVTDITKHNSSLVDFEFELFEFVCKNMKNTELYDVLIGQLLRLWPDLDDAPNFYRTSLDVLKEILSLPCLKINQPDDVLNLCSRWIWYDVENRYHLTIEIANAINRNFMMGCSQYQLETLSNASEYTRQYVKEQLIKILSLAAFVPPRMEPDPWPQPRFIVLKKNGVLNITDANFTRIASICPTILPDQSTKDPKVEIGYPQATMLGDKLFILFTIDNQFYFQVYDPVSSKFISLATDVRMDSKRRYSILNCQDELFFCTGNLILKYSVHLNRWVSFSNEHSSYKKYTSDGKKLYKIFVRKHSIRNGKVPIKVTFYDFKLREWVALPDVPVQVEVTARGDDRCTYTYTNTPIKVDIINNELNILFKSMTYSFNWTAQKWNGINNLRTDFFEFIGYEQNILYVSADEVHQYSPAGNNWTLKQKVPDDFDDVFAIHVVDQSNK